MRRWINWLDKWLGKIIDSRPCFGKISSDTIISLKNYKTSYSEISIRLGSSVYINLVPIICSVGSKNGNSQNSQQVPSHILTHNWDSSKLHKPSY